MNERRYSNKTFLVLIPLFLIVLLSFFHINKPKQIVKTDIHYNRCNPYIHPGHIEEYPNFFKRPAWVLWNDLTGCPDTSTPPLMDALKNRLPLPFLQNKTILLIGDSIDRTSLVHICNLAGGELFKSTYSNPEEEETEDLKAQHQPHHCSFGDYGLNIYNFFISGVCWDDKYYSAWGQGYPESRLEMQIDQRIDQFFIPFLEKIPTPDLTILHALAWDIKCLKTKFEVKGATYPDESIRYYQMKLNLFMGRMRSILPNHIMWRSMFYPSEESKLASVLDVWTLNEAVEPIRDEWGIELFDHGRLITGQYHHFDDVLHPAAEPSGWLYGDMMMYYLREYDRWDKTKGK